MFKNSLKFIVTPLNLPLVERNGLLYECSEKFRMNSNKDLCDVWLIYKSIKTNDTWNMSISRRVKVGSLNASLFDSFQMNDTKTVWKYAFDNEFIKNNGGKIHSDVKYIIECSDDIKKNGSKNLLIDKNHVTVILESRYFIPIKIKSILSNLFYISGSQLQKLQKDGLISANFSAVMGKKQIVEVSKSIINSLKLGISVESNIQSDPNGLGYRTTIQKNWP